MTLYTVALHVEDKKHGNLQDVCIELLPLDGPHAVIGTDPAPAFNFLVNDAFLHHHRITLELGHARNTNKNPVGERAVKELEEELLRQEPKGGPVSTRMLAMLQLNLIPESNLATCPPG